MEKRDLLEGGGDKLKGHRPVMRVPMQSLKHVALRNLLFLALSVAILILSHDPLSKLLSLSRKSELYSHIPLIPVVSAYFIWTRRRKIFSVVTCSARYGIPVLILGIILYFIGICEANRMNGNDSLALFVFASVTCWIGGFLLFYGTRAFRAGIFPLLFLLFLTPIPTVVVETFILTLQVASTEICSFLFGLTGAPVLREGFVFHLPGLSIEVAKQCSGIRSSIALVITSVIAGELFLHAGWRRVVLVLSIFPITVLKNGVRIVTLTLLGTYVDPRILGSELHRSGGIPFFGIALAMVAPVLWILRRSEKAIRDREHKAA